MVCKNFLASALPSVSDSEFSSSSSLSSPLNAPLTAPLTALPTTALAAIPNKGFYSKFGNIAVPSRQFNKINLNASWFKPTPIIIAHRNVQFRSMFSAQYSPNMLVSSEKFSLGGLSSVRGFKEYRENADNALLLRNELVVFLPQQESKIYQKFFGDFSTFTGPLADLLSDVAGSDGGGLGLKFGGG